MEVLRTAILVFCRRRKGVSFYPSEIVRQMYPEDWELFVDDLITEMDGMQKERLIELSQNGKLVRGDEIAEGPIIIFELGKPK